MNKKDVNNVKNESRKHFKNDNGIFERQNL
jgi:hypothetical protein